MDSSECRCEWSLDTQRTHLKSNHQVWRWSGPHVVWMEVSWNPQSATVSQQTKNVAVLHFSQSFSYCDLFVAGAMSTLTVTYWFLFSFFHSFKWLKPYFIGELWSIDSLSPSSPLSLINTHSRIDNGIICHSQAGQRQQRIWSLQTQIMYMFICI